MFIVKNRRQKYGNIKSFYKGQQYDSKAEAGKAMELDSLLKSGEIKAWRRQVPLDLRVNDKHICTYKIDFEVTHNDGTVEFIETKGFVTRDWKQKWDLFNAIYGNKPGVRITLDKVVSSWRNIKKKGRWGR